MIISIYSQSNIDKHAWYVEKFKFQTHFSSHLHVGMNLENIASIANTILKHLYFYVSSAQFLTNLNRINQLKWYLPICILSM